MNWSTQVCVGYEGVDGSVQGCGISGANALEIPQSWAKPCLCSSEKNVYE